MELLEAEGISFVESGLRVRCAWLDIEDEAALVGDLDIETFPTLLIADEVGLRFFGPVTPSLASLSRLVRAVGAPDSSSREHDVLTAGLVAVLPSMPRLWVTKG